MNTSWREQHDLKYTIANQVPDNLISDIPGAISYINIHVVELWDFHLLFFILLKRNRLNIPAGMRVSVLAHGLLRIHFNLKNSYICLCIDYRPLYYMWTHILNRFQNIIILSVIVQHVQTLFSSLNLLPFCIRKTICIL